MDNPESDVEIGNQEKELRNNSCSNIMKNKKCIGKKYVSGSDRENIEQSHKLASL